MTITKIKFLSFIIFLFFTTTINSKIYSQGRDTSQTRRTSRDTSFMRNLPPIGKVIGILRDSSTKEALGFASVALIRLRDSVVAGGNLSDEKGHFSIEDVQPGKYILRISCIGFRKLDSRPFILTPSDPLKDFGTVNVPPTQKTLQQVDITADKTDYVNSLDKKVYNADKDLVSIGGTAGDVLKNVPSVTVDIDGKVSLRGNENVTILIDGKPSGLGGGDKNALLQQLPAGMIDQVEVITNPSARYDAEGMAGIINIKTKKDKRSGVNGTITAGVGTGDKYNGGIILNNRTKKTNLFAQYNFREETRTSTGESTRINSYTPVETIYKTASHNRNYNESHNAKLGSDFYLNDYSTLGLSAGYTHRFERKPETVLYTFEGPGIIVQPGFNRINSEIELSEGIEGNLDFKHTFPGTKHELSTSAVYSQNKRDNNDEYITYVLDTVAENRKSITDGKYITGTFQSDYIHPINDKSKFETGVKATIRNNDNDVIGLKSEEGSTFFIDSLYTDHFIYTDQIYAGYLQYAGRWSVFDFMAGLRAEQTNIQGDSKTDDKDFTTSYINLFPSATIKYTYKLVNELQLGYSRRVNRPGLQQLNPFTDYADSLNVRTGNPQLKPEYISSFELGYFRRFKEQSISATLYFRQTDNLMTRYRTLDTLSQKTTTTFRNFSTAKNTGLEIVIRNQIGKLLSATTSFNIYENKVDGSNVDAELQSSNTNWSIRSTLSLRVTKSTSLQLSGNYMSPNKLPQGSFKGMSGVDAGLKQELMKGKLIFSVNVSDIFNTRKFVIHNIGEGFVYDQTRKRESRVANFTLSYRFGKADTNLFGKKRQNKPELPTQQDFMNSGDF